MPRSRRLMVLVGALAVLGVAAAVVFLWPSGDRPRPEVQGRADQITESMSAAQPAPPPGNEPAQRPPRGAVKAK